MSGDAFDKRADVVNITHLGDGFPRAHTFPTVLEWGMVLEALGTDLRSWRYNPNLDDVVGNLL